jgi:hypothetical protein
LHFYTRQRNRELANCDIDSLGIIDRLCHCHEFRVSWSALVGTLIFAGVVAGVGVLIFEVIFSILLGSLPGLLGLPGF